MIMKKYLEFYINYILRDESKYLFGEGSYIEINEMKFSTNNKTLIITCKLNTTDPELCKETFPSGLEVLINEGLDMSGINDSITLISSIDVI
jgi:hypothetical protein